MKPVTENPWVSGATVGTKTGGGAGTGGLTTTGGGVPPPPPPPPPPPLAYATPAPTAKQIAIAVAILAVLTSPASGYRGCHQPLATAGPNSSQGFLEPTRLIVILLHATGKSERRNPKACRAQTRLGHAGLDLLLC